MGLVQIEDTELAELRRERNEARTQVDTLQTEKRDLTTKAETAEAAQKAAETERDTAKTELQTATETAQKAKLKDQRIGALGAGFLAALGDTSKTRLNELASTCSDEQWNVELAEREEMAKVKRDAAAPEGTPAPGSPAPAPASTAASGFASEEVASFMNRQPPAPAPGAAVPSGGTSVRQLARSFSKPKTPAAAGQQG